MADLLTLLSCLALASAAAYFGWWVSKRNSENRAEALHEMKFGPREYTDAQAAFIQQTVRARSVEILLDERDQAIAHLREVLDWGYGEDAPDQCIQAHNEADAWLNSPHTYPPRIA